ncbi:MAG: glycosyltransferase family 39 protein [Pseudomonadota bacterium]
MIRFLSLPVLLILALALRLVWAALIPVDPVSDANAYHTFAQNIAFHGVYGFSPEVPGAYWAVGAAAIYAGAYMLFGATGFAVVLVNLISSLVAIWGLWDLGRRWYGETAGRIAALLFALWPMTIQFTTVLASELHFIALTLLGLMAWDRARTPTGGAFWVYTLLGGLALAAATYIRPIALLIPAALAFAILVSRPKESLGPLLKAAVITALIFACVAPWSARNERVLGERVFMSTNFWANFWMGNHPGTNGEYAPLPPEQAGLSEIARSEMMREISLGHLRDDPAGFIWRTIWKSFRLHQRETIGVTWNEGGLTALVGDTGATLIKLGSTAWWYAVLAAGLAGVLVLWRRRGVWLTLLAPPVWLWLYFTGVHAVIVVGDRYHMPAIPMIALLAGLALSQFLERRRPADQPALS